MQQTVMWILSAEPGSVYVWVLLEALRASLVMRPVWFQSET